MTKRRYRIGIDASLAFSPRPTGVEHYARSLLEELLALPEPAVDWFVYLPPSAELGGPLPKNVRLRRRPDVNTLIKTPWLTAQTWRDRLEVLFTFGHRIPRLCRGRRVYTVYDTIFDEYPECYPEGAAARAGEEVRAACRTAAGIAVPSCATRAALARNYAFPERRIGVVGAGSRPIFRPGPADDLPGSVSNAGIRAPFFLCVGRVDRRKNVEKAIEAYRLLMREGLDCGGLVIVGPEDSGTARVREVLASRKVPGERIFMTGYVNEPELAVLYRAAVALIYPSLAEGYGLPVLEAMACGTPVITSQLSSLPEVAGNAAMLVDPTDTEAIAGAMAEVLQREDLRQRLKEDGLRRAAELTWGRAASKLAEFLRATAVRDC